MSKNDLVAAYQSGKLSRRSFIRGMTALGLSIAAANHLADSTEATDDHSSHGPHDGGHHHDDVYDHHHHHHGHPPKTSTTTTVTVSTLPSTGEGTSTSERSATTLKTLGLFGTAAAAAATLFRRASRTAPDNE